MWFNESSADTLTNMVQWTLPLTGLSCLLMIVTILETEVTVVSGHSGPWSPCAPLTIIAQVSALLCPLSQSHPDWWSPLLQPLITRAGDTTPVPGAGVTTVETSVEQGHSSCPGRQLNRLFLSCSPDDAGAGNGKAAPAAHPSTWSEQLRAAENSCCFYSSQTRRVTLNWAQHNHSHSDTANRDSRDKTPFSLLFPSIGLNLSSLRIDEKG